MPDHCSYFSENSRALLKIRGIAQKHNGFVQISSLKKWYFGKYTLARMSAALVNVRLEQTVFQSCTHTKTRAVSLFLVTLVRNIPFWCSFSMTFGTLSMVDCHWASFGKQKVTKLTLSLGKTTCYLFGNYC